MAGSLITTNPFWDQVGPALLRRDAYDQFRSYWLRDNYCHLFAWAIPDPDALVFVAEQLGNHAVEMGAGTGYWAWQLQQLGVEIDAYDQAPLCEGYNGFHPDGQPYFPVRRGTPEVLAGYDVPLLLCWPPENEEMAACCLDHYAGNKLVYIGEGRGGHTGNERFFQMLLAEWELVNQFDCVTWPSVSDRVWVLERKSREQR
jgi:hypothetical protein